MPDENNVQTSAVSQTSNHEGKYLTFALGKEDYGIEILKVREIIGMMSITHVPQVPNYIKGVINLRGKVIPIINLRAKFNMDEIEHTAETCIIVVDIDGILIGLLIDKVNDVLNINGESIEPPPQFGSTIDTDFILGIGKVSENMKILLNINKVLKEDVAVAVDIANK